MISLNKSEEFEKILEGVEVENTERITVLEVKEDYKHLLLVLKKFSETTDESLIKSEEDFIEAYKEHTLNIQKKLQEIKEHSKASAVEKRKKERIQNLKKELLWFQSECCRLNDQVNQANKYLQKEIQKLNSLRQEKKLFQQICKKTPQILPSQQDPPSPLHQVLLQQSSPAPSLQISDENSLIIGIDKEIERIKKELEQYLESKTKYPSELQEEFQRLHLELRQEIPKERLTKTDKIRLLRDFILNEKVISILSNKTR